MRSAYSSSVMGVSSSRESSSDSRGQNEADDGRGLPTLYTAYRRREWGTTKEAKSPRLPFRDKKLLRRVQSERAVRKRERDVGKKTDILRSDNNSSDNNDFFSQICYNEEDLDCVLIRIYLVFNYVNCTIS